MHLGTWFLMYFYILYIFGIMMSESVTEIKVLKNKYQAQ